MDLLDLYDRATAWTASKIPAAASQLDAPTNCPDWNVRALVNHLLQGQELFASAATGGTAAPPPGMPPDLAGDDPAAQYEQARQATLEAFRQPGALDSAGMTLGIGFVDQLVHGWDLATATGQDATMPADLAETAFSMIDGRLPADQRGTFFGPAVTVPDDASAQDRLLGYAGRRP